MPQSSARIGNPRRHAIDVPAVANLVGTLAKYLGLVVVFPIGVALWYSEPAWPFIATGLGTSAFGYLLERATPDAKTRLGAREGFLVVSAMLLATAAFASLPYLLVGGEQLDHPIDAYLEGMSAATTTGASVVTDFDELSKSLAMWRQFTQWLGGMGIIILAVAILPRLRVGGRQILETELPGPEVAALSERIRETARSLWGLYVALTVVLALLLASLGWLGVDDAMTPYEALAHAFSTMPTGGFSTKVNSIQAFSPEAQWIIAAFMLIAGVNFILVFRAIVRRHPRVLVRDEEFRLYLALVAVASIALFVQLVSYDLFSGEEAVRTAVFQAISVITTTGYATTDFALWPVLSLLTLFALMFLGGSAGSTTGSIKVVRHLLVGKILRRELDQTVSPEVVMPIRLNGAPVDERTLRAIAAFILLYVGLWAVGASVVAIDVAIADVPLSALDSFAVSASALGNGGPAFGITGPFGSFAPLPDVSKITMILLMWLGRLEIIPVVVLFTRHYWRL
ncbi:MAG TPA: TrkH family potassium uptake protein [Gaiellaceae bacterium]|nr:TrkH family potassium uptake protein [Gaiellaceae bacterium]